MRAVSRGGRRGQERSELRYAVLLGDENPEPENRARHRVLRFREDDCFGDNRYATMFYGEFDSHSGVLLRYVSAGHCSPIFISEAGEAKTLPGGDLPVGLFADYCG